MIIEKRKRKGEPGTQVDEESTFTSVAMKVFLFIFFFAISKKEFFLLFVIEDVFILLLFAVSYAR